MPISSEIIRNVTSSLYEWSLKKVPDDTKRLLAQAERRERDAELTGGQVGVQIIRQILGQLGALVTFLDERIDPAAADFHHCELRCHKEAVHEHQEYDQQKT